jgi:hypothetical protein
MPYKWRGVAVFCFAALCAGAPTTIKAESGPWTATLDGTWRWQAGDNMRWASAAFNDAGWPPLQVPGPLPTGRQYWIRLHLELGPSSDPGLLLGPIAYTYDVYWDGRHIGQFSDLDRGKWFVPRSQTFHLPLDLARVGGHEIAIRVDQIGTNFGTNNPHLAPGNSQVGDFAALADMESARMSAEFQPEILETLIVFGLALAGLYFLLLPPSVSQGPAFRWLGILLLGRALTVLCETYANSGPLNVPGNVLVTLTWMFIVLNILGSIEFAFALFRRQVPKAVRVVECLLAMLAFSWPLPYSALFLRFNTFAIPSIVSITIAWTELRKRTPDASLNLFFFGAIGVANLLGVLAVYPVHAPISLEIGGMRLWVWDIAYLLWVPAITIQVHKTNLRFRDERERLRGEMEAARQVQQLLLPSQSSQFQGFDIDASYHPASEVGGDFFQLFGVVNGSLLVVVGDVSGKGMKAALLVSLIAGALRNRKSDEPAHVLKELNALLLGSSEGGFTTCCCALFGADGGVMIANAGQLVPYRNGEEIPISPALPLGIEANADWPELRIEMAPGDRLLWVSDGVVEARNGKGNLLGFGRAQELATRSAGEIAEAAQQFGQEDDITVISITRGPVPVHVG